MKYIQIVRGPYNSVEDYLVSDEDAQRILEMTPADRDFEIKSYTFGTYGRGFKQYRAFIFPELTTSAEVKEFPA